MDDAEFDLLDELYFVTSFEELQANTDMSEAKIRDTLISLAGRGWICVYENSDEELADFDLMGNFKLYFYLASKKGLLAHNKQ